MRKRNWLIAGLITLLLVFASGVWTGTRLPSGSDPQNSIETVFTPYEDGVGSFVKFLDKARHSVHIAIYSLTDPQIANKLIELQQRGVKVYVLMDLSQSRGFAGDDEEKILAPMRAAGIEVVIGTSERGASYIMHHKFAVLDEEWVEDGSWNYTRAANKQANVLNYIHSPRRAALYLETWHRMYKFMKGQQDKREAAKAAGTTGGAQPVTDPNDDPPAKPVRKRPRK